MKRPMKLTLTATLMASVCALPLIGTAQADQKPTIRIAYVQSWPSSDIMTHLAAAVITQKLGDQVKLTATDAGPMFESVASDHSDVTLTAWLPSTHATYYQKLWPKVINLGPNLLGTKLGLAVPDYVPVKTIAGLEKHAGKFDDRIVGVGAGAGININTEKAIKIYKLTSFRLQASSTAAMTAELKRAIKQHKWIVVTGWSPLWIWAKFHLKYLQDPRQVYGVNGHINTLINPKLPAEAPAVYKFLKHFSITKNELQAMMLDSKNGTKMDKLISDFMAKHPNQVKSWLS